MIPLAPYVRTFVEALTGGRQANGRSDVPGPLDSMIIAQELQSERHWQARIYDALRAFSPGTPIDEFNSLAGRAAQIERMIETVVQRGQHAILFGERGVGKSSLANTFAADLVRSAELEACIHINCHPSDDFSAVWRKVFRRLRDRGVAVSERYSGKIEPDDVVVELSSAKQVIVILDEFDRLASWQARNLIANTIKNLSDRSVSATVFVVGVASSASELIEEHMSILRCLRQIPLERMNSHELGEIVDGSSRRLGMKILPEALACIVVVSRGLPHYAHLFGQQAAKSALEARTLTIGVEHVERAISACIGETAQIIQHQYRDATLSARKGSICIEVLLAAAFASVDSGGYFAPSDLREPLGKILRKEGAGVSGCGYHLKKLCDGDHGSVFARIGSGRRCRYRFSEPMMEPFILMQGLRNRVVTWPQLFTLEDSRCGPRLGEGLELERS